MKILMGVPEYPPHHIGGGGEVFKKLAQRYRELGHEVVVFYGYYRTKSIWEDLKRREDENGIRFYEIPEIPYPKSMPFLKTVMPPTPRARFKLPRAIEKEAPDVAHLHGYGLPTVNLMAYTLHRLGIRYLFTIHGYPRTPYEKNLFAKYSYVVYDRVFTDRTLAHAYMITGVSDFVAKDERLGSYRDKTLTILNGIDQEDYGEERGNQELDIYEELGLKKGSDITIFSMGRLAENKGFQKIIDKMGIFESNGLSVHYIIAGSDYGYLARLREMAKIKDCEDNVHFIGWRDKEDIISILHQCDMFAIPSLWDICPIAAFEGMACNKFIISSEGGGIEEVLRGYPHKIRLFDDDFDDKIVDIIKEKKYIVAEPVDLREISWRNVAEKYLRLMQGGQRQPPLPSS